MKGGDFNILRKRGSDDTNEDGEACDTNGPVRISESDSDDNESDYYY